MPPLAGWLQFLLQFGTEAGCWWAREGTFVYILKAVTACWSQIKLSSSYSSVSVPETVFPSAFDLIFFLFGVAVLYTMFGFALNRFTVETWRPYLSKMNFPVIRDSHMHFGLSVFLPCSQQCTLER